MVVFQGGMFVFQMFDYYSGSRIIILIAAFECITIAWIYGNNLFLFYEAPMCQRLWLQC